VKQKLPYKDQAVLERLFDSLRKAGLKWRYSVKDFIGIRINIQFFISIFFVYLGFK
jgi:hypothetical protein